MAKKDRYSRFTEGSDGNQAKLGRFLDSIYLNNFKSFFNEKMTRIKFAPRITLIFGRNSSGKSSIIHALQLMEQSNKKNNDLFLNPPDNDPGGLKFIDLKAILSNGDFSKDLTLGLRSRDSSIFTRTQEHTEDSKSIIKKFSFKNKKINSMNVDYYSHSEPDNLKNEKFVSLENSFFNFYDIKNYYTSKITYVDNKYTWKELFKYSKVHKIELLKRLKECVEFDIKVSDILSKKKENTKEQQEKFNEIFKNAERNLYVFSPTLFNFRTQNRPKIILDHADFLFNLNKITYEEFIKYISNDIQKSKKYFFKNSQLFNEEEMFRNLRNVKNYQFDDEIRKITWDNGYSCSSLANFLCWNLTQICGGSRPSFFGFDPNSKDENDVSKTLEPKDMIEMCKSRIENIIGNVLIFQGQKPLPQKYEASEGTSNFIGYDYSNLASVIKSHSNKIDKWIKHFGYDFKVKTETSGALNETYIFHKKNNTKINYKMGGLGAENILPVIAQSVAADGKIIVWEEPERRAHPALQVKMADLFVECSKDNQFIVETHSENLLLGVLKNIKDGKISHKDVQITYVYIKNGQSKIDELEVNEQGMFGSSWRDGFFTERLSLL